MKRQLRFELHGGRRGGWRPKSGRKRNHSKGVAHEKREKVVPRYALHINFKVKTFIRNKIYLQVLKRAIRNARSQGLSVLHFSLQSNHVHLLVEARSNIILTKGMRSLTITFAKGVKQGRIQAERYHLHVLKTLRATRNAVYYVLFNQQKHSGLKTAYMDMFCSLRILRDLKGLAKEARMTIIIRKVGEMSFLSPPEGWMIRKILNDH